MNLELFLASLSHSEKKQLHLLLDKNLKNTGTVIGFIESMEPNRSLSVRLTNVLHSPKVIDLLISEITDDNAFKLGFGNRTYAEFLEALGK